MLINWLMSGAEKSDDVIHQNRLRLLLLTSFFVRWSSFMVTESGVCDFGGFVV